MNMQVSYDSQSLRLNPNVAFNHFKALQINAKIETVNYVAWGLHFNLVIPCYERFNQLPDKYSCLLIG